MKWNAQLYEMFGMERLQPTLDLVNRIPDKKYSRIIDIGCGTGMSTLPLVNKFEDAQIYGVDFSEEMLKKAREITNKVEWLQRDCSKPLSDLGKFDLVFSNAFLQWLQNQEEFIENVTQMLNKDGVFALQVPNYDNMAIRKCTDHIIAPFKNRFKEVEKKMCHNKTLNEYYDILSEYFEDIVIWQTSYCHVMDTYEDIFNFISSTGIRPYLEVLNENEKEQFKNDLILELKKVYPIQKNGKILFPFERIEFVAKSLLVL